MHTDQFDRLVRRLATRRLTRRTALQGLGGAACAVAAGGRHRRMASARDAIQNDSPSELAVRRDGASLSPDERAAFVNAVLTLKQQPSSWMDGQSVYDTFALWHRDSLGCDVNAAHMAPAFLPWHRAFLLLFEEQLQAVDPTVNVPYWDWTVDNTPDSYLWHDDFMGGDGDPAQGHVVTTGPFAEDAWTIEAFDYNDTVQNRSLIRDLGGGSLALTLPTAEDVEAALNVATYDAAPWNSTSPLAESFRNTLEGWRDCVAETCDPVVGMGPTCTGPSELHNRVHLWVSGEFAFTHQQGGDMAGQAESADPHSPASSLEIFGTMAAASSPSDPVFWLHRANIDRLWNEWLRRHGPNYLPVSGGPAGHNLNDPMWPYEQIGLTVTPAMMLDSRALGYVYDTDA